jgi:hypothetical protein
MTIREATQTLDGETKLAADHPVRLGRMRGRLARLKAERAAAAAAGYGAGVLDQIDSDIFWQEAAIERALRCV